MIASQPVTLLGVAWSDALSAIFTTLAVIVALGVAVLEYRTNSRERREADGERRRRDDEGVTAWTQAQPGGSVELVVLNCRKFPIFDVHLWKRSTVGSRRVAGVIPPADRRTLVIPEWHGVEDRAMPVTFMDSSGEWWTWLGTDGIPADPSAARGFKILERTPDDERPY